MADVEQKVENIVSQDVPGDLSSDEEHTVLPQQPSDEIPDGGLVAWTQVLAGHLVIFNCWGYITSYVLSLCLLTRNYGWISSINDEGG